MSAQVQIIERDGKPEYAVVPIELYRQLLTLVEDAEDIRAANIALQELNAGEDEAIPAAVARRLLSGTEHPLRIWREHRGLTQEALAAQAGVGKSYLSQIEAGKKTGSARILRTLAQILRVDMDDLLMPPAQE